jgi:hypothetical protein
MWMKVNRTGSESYQMAGFSISCVNFQFMLLVVSYDTTSMPFILCSEEVKCYIGP